MNPTTKAAVIEALESCDPGDWSTGQVIHPSYNEDKVNAALALLYAEPEPTPEPGERERFEAWYFDKYMLQANRHLLDPERYAYPHTQDSWTGWQARASLPPPTKGAE